MVQTIEMMVTVKTYPIPSTKPDVLEHVCTAGVTREGKFVRLFPLNFRYRPYEEQFKKYDWIRVNVQKAKGDKRPESYSHLLNQEIVIIGHTSADHNWRDRKETVLACGLDTACDLNQQEVNAKSLALIRPARVFDIKVKSVEATWKPQLQAQLNNAWLFGPQQKPLEKIPYEFSYQFKCSAPGCPGRHEMMIADWELGTLYLRLIKSGKSEDTAVRMVRAKYLDEMCAENIDTHFFLGTLLAHPKNWIVLGVFWPKKEQMANLF